MANTSVVHDPEGWEAASARAVAARVNVAVQFADQLADAGGGSRELFAQRVAGIMEAERTGDPMLLRAAVMEVTVAAGAWAASLDLQGVA